jgi:hypothetical protein
MMAHKRKGRGGMKFRTMLDSENGSPLEKII